MATIYYRRIRAGEALWPLMLPTLVDAIPSPKMWEVIEYLMALPAEPNVIFQVRAIRSIFMAFSRICPIVLLRFSRTTMFAHSRTSAPAPKSFVDGRDGRVRARMTKLLSLLDCARACGVSVTYFGLAYPLTPLLIAFVNRSSGRVFANFIPLHTFKYTVLQEAVLWQPYIDHAIARVRKSGAL